MCPPLWPLFTRLQLAENIHAREDSEFSKFLLALGNGELQVEENELICIPTELCLINEDVYGNLDDLLKQIHPQIASECALPEMFAERAILTPRNKDVDLINSKLI